MDAARFVAPDWGRAVNTGGQFGYVAFRPQPLPRELALDGPIVLALSDADAALGRLAGAGRLLLSTGISPKGNTVQLRR